MTKQAVMEMAPDHPRTRSRARGAGAAPVAGPGQGPGRGREAGRWQARHRALIKATDVVVLTGAGVTGYVVHVVGPGAGTAAGFDLGVASALLGGTGVWLLALGGGKAYDWHLFGAGVAEYQRVLGATWKSFGVVAIAAWLSSWTGARDALFVAFALGAAGLLLGRFVWRRRIHHLRKHHAACMTEVVAVGHRVQVERLIQKLNDAPDHGYVVVGACVPGAEGAPGDSVAGVPVIGGPDKAAELAQEVCAGAVAVSSSHEITSDDVRRLGWNLEERGIDLMLTAELADVAVPRISVSPAPGMSLLHVDLPKFNGPKYVVKQVMDRSLAFVLAVLAAPLILVLALAVVLTSRGPAFYLSERVGRNGDTFPMVKLRTMQKDADRLVPALAPADEGAGLLFKLKEDPRVTPVGKVLRRYSLDELPQLFNVLAGQMSLVGPRPGLPREAAGYEERMRRRLLVKPGMTGLWQVRGRSDLSWDEAVRCDVYYAENWTPQLDLLILAQTARAVVSARGAY